MAAPTDMFVGRSRELAMLRDALEGAVAGQGRMVLLAGEPGIGKTRTAQELADQASRHGAIALWGRCHEEAGAPPYWPWVQIIRTALQLPETRGALDAIGAGASDIADIVPEVRDLIADLQPPDRLQDAAQARFRMFESIRQLLAVLSRRRLAVLVLDDVHWADVPSLRLLEFLAQELADSRILLAGTYRPTELSRRHPLSDTLGELARAPHVVRIPLTGLNAQEVQEFIAAATGASPTARLSSSLQAQTEGNPLFLREIVRFLQQQGVFSGDNASPLAAIPPAIRIPRA
jgi:predicted ATPase